MDYPRLVERRGDGWYLTFAGLGPPGVPGDEIASHIPKLVELSPSPLRRPGWVRRGFQRSLDLTHQGARIHVVLLGYALDAGASVDAVSLRAVDGVLVFTTGDVRKDEATRFAVARALAARGGEPSPPAIVEMHAASDDPMLGKRFRALVRRALDALQAGRLPDFGEVDRKAAAERERRRVRDALTAERILALPRERLVKDLVDLWAERRARSRARAPAGEGDRGPVPPPAWAALLAVVDLEILVADSGFAALFDRPERRFLEPSTTRLAMETYARLGLDAKASILSEAIRTAQEAELWSTSRTSAAGDAEQAFSRIDELAQRFEAEDPADVQERLAGDVLARPEAFALPALER
jgi:hypothetical protein